MKHELQAILTKYGSMITASASEVEFYGEVASFCQRLPDDAQNPVGGIGSISASDFKYAKMQTVHQLLVNTVSRPTETTEKAIELARMVDAAFAALDAADMGDVSDGYHTFNELYAHRVRLFSALMRAHVDKSWWSDTHHDGSAWDGWIIAGIDTPAGTATYHLPVSEVDQLADIARLERGKEWDGHTAADVLERLKSL